MNPKLKNLIKKMIKNCPLVVCIIISIVAMTGYSLIGAMMGKFKLKLSMDHPLFVSALLKEDREEKEKNEPPATDTDYRATTELPTPTDVTDDTKLPIPTEYQTGEMRIAKSPYYDDDNRIALTTDYPYITVDSSYFEDALFIGDSRVVGLMTFSTIDNADFFCKEGITLYDIMDERVADIGEGATTIPDALSKKKYNKIYIMLGVNELGYKTTTDYYNRYIEVVGKIKELQPDAVIFIMGMMHFTTEYASGEDVYNNDNINNRNAAVASIANGIDVFYLDMNTAVDDSTGGVKAEYTYDGIHLQAQYYSLWVDFLLQHGLEDDMFPGKEQAPDTDDGYIYTAPDTDGGGGDTTPATDGADGDTTPDSNAGDGDTTPDPNGADGDTTLDTNGVDGDNNVTT